jgi:hypothetical protein
MHWDERRFQKREREQGAYRIYEHVIGTQDRALFSGRDPPSKIVSQTIEVVRNVQNYYGVLG